MAKRELSAGQRKIVDRYYEHLDAITIHKLQELISDLALADGAAADRLWKRVEKHLTRAASGDPRVQAILDARDVGALAKLVAELV